MKQKGYLLPLLAFGAHAQKAVGLEYHTYGGFEQICGAFEKIAYLFNDHKFTMLATVFLIMSLSMGALKAIFRTQFGMNGNGVSILEPFVLAITGALCFQALVTTRMDIAIHDCSTGKSKLIQKLPALLVMAAATTNSIERQVIERIQSNSALPYTQESEGLSFRLLLDATLNPPGCVGSPLYQNLKYLFEYCEPIKKAIGHFKKDQLLTGEMLLIDGINALNHPILETRCLLNNENSRNQWVSCTQGVRQVVSKLLENSNEVDIMFSNICKRQGLKDSPRCREAFSRGLKNTFGEAHGDITTYLRNVMIANAYADVLQNRNPNAPVGALAHRDMLNKSVAEVMAGDGFNMHNRAVLLVVVLSCFPILALFLATQGFAKILQLLLGLFGWVALCGICDAIFQQNAQEAMLRMFAEIKEYNMGLKAIWEAPTALQKSLMLLGNARSNVFMIASFISTALFGGSYFALQGIGQGLTRTASDAFKRAADVTQTPHAHAEALEGTARAVGTYGAVKESGFHGMTQEAVYARMQSMRNANTVAEGFGGNASTAGSAIGDIGGGAQVGNARATQRMAQQSGQSLSARAATTAQTETLQRTGQADGTITAAEKMQFSQGVYSATKENALNMGQKAHGDAATQAKMRGLIQQLRPDLNDRQIQETLTDFSAAPTTGTIHASDGNPEQVIDSSRIGSSELMARQKAYEKNLHNKGLTVADAGKAEGEVQGFRSTGKQQALDQMNSKDREGLIQKSTLDTFSQASEGKWTTLTAEEFGGPKEFTDFLSWKNSARTAGQLSSDAAIANTLGMSLKAFYQTQGSTGRSLAVTGEQARGLHEKGMLTAEQYQVAKDGARLSFSFDQSGHMLNSTVATGSSASTDNSRTLRAGTETGGRSSKRTLVQNPHYVKELLPTKEGRRQLAIDSAEALSDYQSANRANASSWSGSLQLAGGITGKLKKLVTTEGGIKGNFSGQRVETDRLDSKVVTGTFSQLLSNLRSVANQRYPDKGQQDNFVATQYAGITRKLFDQAQANSEEVAKKMDGKSFQKLSYQFMKQSVNLTRDEQKQLQTQPDHDKQ